MGGDAKLSVTHATYYAPSLQPGFMGAYPPTKTGQGSLFDNGNISYFQGYRNETISKFQMPSADWGLINTPYSPRPDLVAANKNANMERMLSAPKCNMTMVDQGRRGQVDTFYKACQDHRDAYRDHTGKLHPLRYFKLEEYTYQCPPEITRTYTRFPEYYTTYKQPITLPITMGRTNRIPGLPDRALTGRYDRGSCIRYKR